MRAHIGIDARICRCLMAELYHHALGAGGGAILGGLSMCAEIINPITAKIDVVRNAGEYEPVME